MNEIYRQPDRTVEVVRNRDERRTFGENRPTEREMNNRGRIRHRGANAIGREGHLRNHRENMNTSGDRMRESSRRERRKVDFDMGFEELEGTGATSLRQDTRGDYRKQRGSHQRGKHGENYGRKSMDTSRDSAQKRQPKRNGSDVPLKARKLNTSHNSFPREFGPTRLNPNEDKPMPWEKKQNSSKTMPCEDKHYSSKTMPRKDIHNLSKHMSWDGIPNTEDLTYGNSEIRQAGSNIIDEYVMPGGHSGTHNIDQFHPSCPMSPLPDNRDLASIVLHKVCEMFDGNTDLLSLGKFLFLNKIFDFNNSNNLYNFLKEFREVFEISGDEEVRDTQEDGELLETHREDQYRVSAKIDLKLCIDHSKKAGSCRRDCNALHICKFYIMSNCEISKSGRKCLFGHEMNTEHNKAVMRKLLLHKIDNSVILKLKYRNSTTAPVICSFYNTPKGCTNRQCQFLHVCKDHISATCDGEFSCNLSHDLQSGQAMGVLSKHGMGPNEANPDEVLNTLRRVATEQKSLQPLKSPVFNVPRIINRNTRGDNVAHKMRSTRYYKNVDMSKEKTSIFASTDTGTDQTEANLREPEPERKSSGGNTEQRKEKDKDNVKAKLNPIEVNQEISKKSDLAPVYMHTPDKKEENIRITTTNNTANQNPPYNADRRDKEGNRVSDRVSSTGKVDNQEAPAGSTGEVGQGQGGTLCEDDEMTKTGAMDDEGSWEYRAENGGWESIEDSKQLELKYTEYVKSQEAMLVINKKASEINFVTMTGRIVGESPLKFRRVPKAN